MAFRVVIGNYVCDRTPSSSPLSIPGPFLINMSVYTILLTIEVLKHTKP